MLLLLGTLTVAGLPHRGAAAWERFVAYAAVFGGIRLAELSFRLRRVGEWGRGLLSLIAAAVGFVVIGVEANRAVPAALAATAILADGDWTALLTALGLWLRSRATRLLAASLTGITVLGTALVGDALAQGPWLLRIAAFALAIGGA